MFLALQNAEEGVENDHCQGHQIVYKQWNRKLDHKEMASTEYTNATQTTQELPSFPLLALFKIAALSKGCSGPFFPPFFLPLPLSESFSFSFIAISIAFLASLNSFILCLPKEPWRLLSDAERRRGSWMMALKVSKTFWIDT